MTVRCVQLHIILNGKPDTCEETSLSALAAARGSGREITIVNGFATSDDLPLHEGDEIYFIPKDRLPPRDALEAMMWLQ